jgi:hypothetical protein
MTDIGQFFMSRDAGMSWTRLQNKELEEIVITPDLFAIHPKKPNLLYFGGDSVFELKAPND